MPARQWSVVIKPKNEPEQRIVVTAQGQGDSYAMQREVFRMYGSDCQIRNSMPMR